MGPLFIHQLSHCWLDFRGIVDGFMQARARLFREQPPCRARAAELREENPQQFRGYGPLCWGVSASDGPGPATKTIDNVDRVFWMYEARGVPDGPDDGTLAPAPSRRRSRLRRMLVTDTLRGLARVSRLAQRHGLRASLNPTFGDWVSPLNYGLDQGPIVMMIENHRTGLLWNSCGAARISGADCGRRGFAGGWLESEREPQCPQAVEGGGASGVRHSASCPRARRKANDGSASDGNHAGRADPLLRRSDRCQDASRRSAGAGARQVLVRVKAAGVNPMDWMVAEGKARSWLDHRLPLTLGWELAGTVEKLGADVGRFKPGDEVFGMIDLSGDGADAEFAVADENALAIKPDSLDFPRGGRTRRRADGVPGAV